jgi:hypothetical protein
MRQIHAATEHEERGNFECATTLADAAKCMLADADELHFLQILNEVSRSHEIRAAGVVTVPNDCMNWVKHARLISNWQRFEEAIITDVELIATIRRAIARFLVAYPEVKTPQMLSFENWERSFGSRL